MSNQPDHNEEVLEMVTDSTQELDEILNAVTNFTYDAMAHRGDPLVGTLPTMDKATAKQAIIDWHNNQIEAVLDRLASGENYWRAEDDVDLVRL